MSDRRRVTTGAAAAASPPTTSSRTSPAAVHPAVEARTRTARPGRQMSANSVALPQRASLDFDDDAVQMLSDDESASSSLPPSPKIRLPARPTLVDSRGMVSAGSWVSEVGGDTSTAAGGANANATALVHVTRPRLGSDGMKKPVSPSTDKRRKKTARKACCNQWDDESQITRAVFNSIDNEGDNKVGWEEFYDYVKLCYEKYPSLVVRARVVSLRFLFVCLFS